MNHVARADDVQEVLRIVGMRRVLHCVQVIQISKELVEPMDRRQEFVEIPEVVLAELASGVALCFEGGSNRTSLRWYADLSTSLADRRHASGGLYDCYRPQSTGLRH